MTTQAPATFPQAPIPTVAVPQAPIQQAAQPAQVPVVAPSPAMPSVPADDWKTTAFTAVALASSGAGAYHGYKRNHGSIGWALWWSLMGGMFPIFTPAIALAQGFGKPAGVPAAFAGEYHRANDDVAEALHGRLHPELYT